VARVVEELEGAFVPAVGKLREEAPVPALEERRAQQEEVRGELDQPVRVSRRVREVDDGPVFRGLGVDLEVRPPVTRS